MTYNIAYMCDACQDDFDRCNCNPRRYLLRTARNKHFDKFILALQFIAAGEGELRRIANDALVAFEKDCPK